MVAAIERGAGIAVWRQIQQTLTREIETGAYKPGDRLPTEGELAGRFAVNRHTLRRAVAALRDAGMVRIEQGRGTFVQEDVVPYMIGRRTRFSENIANLKRLPKGRLLRAAEAPASAVVARELKVRLHRSVVALEILREVDDRPLALVTHYFAKPRFAGIAERFRESGSLTKALAALGVEDYFRRSTRLTARLPSGDEARHLQQPASVPVLVAESVNVDAAGAVVDYAVGCYAGQRVELVVQP